MLNLYVFIWGLERCAEVVLGGEPDVRETLLFATKFFPFQTVRTPLFSPRYCIHEYKNYKILWQFPVYNSFAGTLEPIFRQLEAMNLDKSAFVIISVVGQELLAAGQYTVAVIVLESALRIGTCSLKLRGSVFSALSSAYWALNSLDKVSVTIFFSFFCCCWYLLGS